MNGWMELTCLVLPVDLMVWGNILFAHIHHLNTKSQIYINDPILKHHHFY